METPASSNNSLIKSSIQNLQRRVDEADVTDMERHPVGPT